MNPIREMRVHVTCLIKVYDEPESPSKGTFSMYMMTRICHEGGCCRDMMNPPNKGACSMYMMNRNRQMWMNRNRQMRERVFF